MADFGESFLSAMNTGLNVARSYRDEARLNDQIKRQNRRDDLTEKLALSAEDRAVQLFGQQSETYKYNKDTLRPIQEKSLNLGLRGQEIGNETAEIDLKYKPEIIQTGLAATRANISQSYASADASRANTRNARIQGDIAQMGLDSLRKDKETQSFISGVINGTAPAGDLRKFEVPLLQFTGLTSSAARTREVLGQTSRGDFSWTQDKGAVMSVQNFLRPEATRSATMRGLDPRSADVASFAPAKGGIAVNYSAFDRAGNLKVWQEIIPSDRLFAKVDIAGGAAAAFRNSTTAQSAAVSMYQRMNPDGYRRVAAAAQESIDDKIDAYRTAASKLPAGAERREAEVRAENLERNRNRAVTEQVVNYLGIAGGQIGRGTSANRALVAIRQDAPNLTDQEAADRAGIIRQQMAKWRQDGTLNRLQQSGVFKSFGNKVPGDGPIEDINAYYAITGDPKALRILGRR